MIFSSNSNKPLGTYLIADTGISMGDEGKGRLVYELIADLTQATGNAHCVGMVLKVNGGANSGHTAGGLKLNLLPAGVIAKNVAHLGVGAGVVADPRKFLWEALPLEKRGHSIISRLAIDERCMIADISHRILDLSWEYYRENTLGQEPRGVTGRGISPSYMDETGQFQMTYALFRSDRENYETITRFRLQRAAAISQYVCKVPEEVWFQFFDTLTQAEKRANQEAIKEGVFSEDEFDFSRFCSETPFQFNEQEVVQTYWNAGQSLKNQVTDIRECVLACMENNQHIIGEFGQSFWLDKRHGFPPNVTASHTFVPEFFQSAGIPCQPVHNVGVAKAYDTKVGTHVFLTEIPSENPLGKHLRKLEFGTSTGRQRMVGWFDALEKGDALRYGGCQSLMINKLDALSRCMVDKDWDGILRVCIAYEDASGKQYYHVPRNDSLRRSLRPVYQEFPAWEENISEVRQFEELPTKAKNYLGGMLSAVYRVAFGDNWRSKSECLPPLLYVGVGPDPDQIIRNLPDPLEITGNVHQ